MPVGLLRVLPMLWLALVCAGPRPTAAAQNGVGGAAGLNAALLRLLDPHIAFTAELDLRVFDAKTNLTLHAPMRFHRLDGKLRGELEIARLKSGELPALAASAAKSVGMERVVTVVRTDRRESWLLYPAFQACLVAPLDADEAAALGKPATITRTRLAEVELAGHRCQQERVVVTEPDGRQHTAMVWRAPALKDFPLRLETRAGSDTILMEFRDVQFTRPDAALFELPQGTTRHEDPQQLMQAVMQRMLGQALGGK